MEEFSLKTIGEYRARYPQLRELTDYQLTRAVYDTTAPDMPLEDFAKAFGGVTEEDPEAPNSKSCSTTSTYRNVL